MLPEHQKWDHAIKLTPGAEPKSLKVYPLSPLEQEELNTFLEENLHTGRIYHKWSLTICDGCFDTLKSSKMRS